VFAASKSETHLQSIHGFEGLIPTNQGDMQGFGKCSRAMIRKEAMEVVARAVMGLECKHRCWFATQLPSNMSVSGSLSSRGFAAEIR